MPRRAKQPEAEEPQDKKVALNGLRLPDPLAAGEILIDMRKNKWRLGRSIGQGGFGEIYLASNNLNKAVNNKAEFVVKIEPHSNGPLFTEMHCYMRIGRPEQVEAWKKKKNLKTFGMPKFLGAGSHFYNDHKYRFVVLERYGSDLQKILDQHDKKMSIKTVYHVGIQILDVLEYIHSKEYIHADIKASNLLVGFKPGTEKQVYLVDYGLACRYANEGIHKEYNYDLRKAHDGTMEFTSRDAHIGAHSRRGDLEILGYNLVQWLCSRLPWEDNLQDYNYVATQKRGFMDKVDKFLNRCFPEPDSIPPGLEPFLEYVANLTFDDTPDYERCRTILREGLKAKGHKVETNSLIFSPATPKAPVRKSKNKPGRKRGTKRRSEEEENIAELNPAKQRRSTMMSPCMPRNIINRINTRRCHRVSDIGISLSKPSQIECNIDPEDLLIEQENKKMLARRQMLNQLNVVVKKKDTSLDNPTPQMLALLAKRREKTISPAVCFKKHHHNKHCTILKSYPSYDEAPTDLTPEMEIVMRGKKERSASQSDSEGYSSSSSSASFKQSAKSDDSDSYDSDDSMMSSCSYWQSTTCTRSKKFSTKDSRCSGGSVSTKRTVPPITLKRTRTIRTRQVAHAQRVTRSTSRNCSPDIL